MLISVTRFDEITGSDSSAPSASAAAAASIIDAQRLLEEMLGRGLELGERTERIKVFADGAMYPRVTPLVSVPDGAEIEGGAVVGGAPSGSFLTRSAYTPTHTTLTYTGGYDPAEDDLAAATYVPIEIQRAIAWAALALLTDEAEFDVPAGATSVSVGDVSIAWGPGGSPGRGDLVFPHSIMRRYRWRRDMAA